MSTVEQITTKAYCNVLAQEKGLDPVGHAGSFDDAILFEIPLPWKKEIYQKADPMPQEVIDLTNLWLDHYRATGEYRHRLLFIAPDAEYSKPGFRRVMFYPRPIKNSAAFSKIEYSVPEDKLGPLVWALYQAQETLPHFDAYRVPEADSVRDILVCTHGTVDAACAKFGYPLYNTLRRQYANEHLRVWRVSHFGGHVFAPTLMDMPTGHYWAYVEESQAKQIVEWSGDVKAMRGHYRGWAGLHAGFMQAVERELWQQYGWDWFGYQKSAEILAQDTEQNPPQWADVRITFSSPDGRVQGVMDAHIEVLAHIETITTTGNTHTHNYPQYRIAHLAP